MSPLRALVLIGWDVPDLDDLLERIKGQQPKFSAGIFVLGLIFIYLMIESDYSHTRRAVYGLAALLSFLIAACLLILPN